MDATLQEILLVVGFFLALSVIPIVFQVWLATCEKKWLAWILPSISFLISLNATYTSYLSSVAEGISVLRAALVFVLFNLLTIALCVATRICHTVQQRREARAAAKKEKEKTRAEKDAARQTIELK